MDTFLQITPARRHLAFQQVDETMGLQAVSVEKDFWVCWTLREFFSLQGIAIDNLRHRLIGTSVFFVP